jgi:hypothetical protein
MFRLESANLRFVTIGQRYDNMPTGRVVIADRLKSDVWFFHARIMRQLQF